MKTVIIVAALAATAPVCAQVVEAPSMVNAVYRPASDTEKLKPGEKIADLFDLNMKGPYVLQRLTDRTCFYQSGFYGTTFHVGDRDVLLFDPLEMRTEPMLAAIRSITSLPITAIAYSHDHGDHIGGAQALLDALATQQSQKPRVIASRATAGKMRHLHGTLPRPTEEVKWPRGSF